MCRQVQASTVAEAIHLQQLREQTERVLTGICAVLGFCLGRHLAGSPGERAGGCDVDSLFINPPSIIWTGWQQVRARPNPNPVRGGQRDSLRGRICCCGSGLSGHSKFAGSQSTAGTGPVNSRGTADVQCQSDICLQSCAFPGV